ncbi:MAG: hypothetical protein JW860_00430 [Sedimentisphaerales bacterium]|nr:hypothetical protein [Sedimentisphaerales bacterium]
MSEESGRAINVAGLPEDVGLAVRYLAEQLGQDLGGDLESLTVVGSAAAGDFHPRYSDINTVLVLARRRHETLQRLAGYGVSMGKRKLKAPLLMTAEYIQRSLDVFGMEFLDFQLNHRMVCGPDPFADLEIRKNDVRLQCERQLKSALIKLRQSYITLMGKPKLVGRVMVECLGELAVILRAMLWLKDMERPREFEPTLRKAAEPFSFKVDDISELIAAKKEYRLPDKSEFELLFQNLYQMVDNLSRQVDQLEISG